MQTIKAHFGVADPMRTTRPFDLVAVAVVALAAMALALLDGPSWLRVPLGLLFVLAAPGYAFVAALYPERHVAAQEEGGIRRGLEPLERTALSLGLSIAIVPLLGLALNYTPWGIRLVPVILTVGAFTLVTSLVAWRRRSRLPVDERLEFVIQSEGPAWKERSGLDRALTVALVCAVLFAAGSLVYVLVKPRETEQFTEFYILGAGGKAACYPSQWNGQRYVPTAREAIDCPLDVDVITVGIVNHEGTETTYWLRLVWTNETRQPDNTTVVNAVQEINTTTITLPHVKVDLSLDAEFTPQYEQALQVPAPPWPGTSRLSLQLYREPPPAIDEPDLLGSPYRRLHLFITAPPNE